MKVSIKTLSGRALAWAVAKALGYELHKDELLAGQVMRGWWYSHPERPNVWSALKYFRPASDWSLGGPITLKHQINLQYCTDLRDSNRKYVWADMGTNSAHGYSDGHGQPLVAAMRCLVAYHAHGREDMEIPEELLS